MIRKRLPRCRKCGSFFMLRAAEMQLFENLGSNVRPSVCSYCRQLEIDRLYEEARTDPAKRVECQCSICRRSFVLPIMLRMRKADYLICPECIPPGLRFSQEEIIRLNKDLGYPRKPEETPHE